MTGVTAGSVRRSGVVPFGLALAMCVALVVALSPGEVQAAKHKHNVRAWLDNTCVGGDAPKGSHLWVTWKSKSGAVKKKGKVKASSKGRWSLCTGSKRVAQGDRVMAKLGKDKRTAVVPRMDVSVDRETNVVSGRSKANKQLVVQVCSWRERFLDTHCETGEVKSDGSGRFSADLDTVVSSGELLGGDSVEVFTIGSGLPHGFGRMQRVPYVEVVIGDSKVSGAYEPGKSLSVDLKDSGLSTKASWSGGSNNRAKVWSKVYQGHVRVSGIYSGRFSPSGPVVQVGDRIQSPVLPPSYGLPIYDLDVSAAPGSDVVSGTCATKSRYQLKATTSGKSKTLPLRMTDADGVFSRDLTGKHDVRSGTVVKLICDFNTGDRVAKRYTVP